ncbi:MAG: response regulator transcription factor [Clostridiales Family XIII bacterium]|jgi:DNA-binding response OmpR family regulator|nr:response regulator transcription factor [Clostridiales Family XIII bacterium]
MKILLVEDEKRLSEAVATVLKKNHFSVDVANDGEEGLDLALSDIYDVLLLDIMLPKVDGLEILRQVREDGNTTPVIMLTAKGEVSDKVVGLDQGADDYLPKPFAMEELIARIKAVARRRSGDDDVLDDNLRYGDLVYNPHKLYLSCADQGFELTMKEGQLLEYLMINSGHTSSADSIIDKVWGWDSEAMDANVQVYISFLRKKLKNLNSEVGIRNIRNVGYQLTGGK